MQELLGVHVPPPREDFVIRETFVESALRKGPLPHLDRGGRGNAGAR